MRNDDRNSPTNPAFWIACPRHSSIASSHRRMNLRPIRTAFVAAALYAVVLVSTASAEEHRVRVTLVTGQVLTYTVDVAQGATATAAQLPPLPSPVKTIEDLGPLPTVT